MTLTTAELIGTPAFDGQKNLDSAISIWKKATSASSAIAVGRIAVRDESTGLGSLATTGSTGQMGVVPKLDPVNVDSDATFNVIDGIGSEIYIEAQGTIKVGARVMPYTGGKGQQYVAGDVTATPTESTIESAIKDFQRAPFVYVGHYGEGSGHGEPATDATTGDAIRVRKIGV